MFDNFTSFIDIWTTNKDGVNDAGEATVNVVSIPDARWAALVHLAIGVVVGPFVHRKTGFKPLI